MLSYLTLALQPDNAFALERALSAPSRGISKERLAALLRWLRDARVFEGRGVTAAADGEDVSLMSVLEDDEDNSHSLSGNPAKGQAGRDGDGEDSARRGVGYVDGVYSYDALCAHYRRVFNVDTGKNPCGDAVSKEGSRYIPSFAEVSFQQYLDQVRHDDTHIHFFDEMICRDHLHHIA